MSEPRIVLPARLTGIALAMHTVPQPTGETVMTDGQVAFTVTDDEHKSQIVVTLSEKNARGFVTANHKARWKVHLRARRRVMSMADCPNVMVLHERYEECTLDAADQCTGCGVSHTGECACGGRGFHREWCPERESC